MKRTILAAAILALAGCGAGQDYLFATRMHNEAPVVTRGATDEEVIETGLTVCYLIEDEHMTPGEVVANAVSHGAPQAEAELLYELAVLYLCPPREE